LAEMVFAGTFNIYLPNNPTMTQEASGECTIDQPYRVFALWPHMHKLATAQKIELVRNGEATPLHDMPYNFEEQKYWLQSPEIQLEQDDKIRVTCSYVNDTGGLVTFGDSSDKEMCFG